MRKFNLKGTVVERMKGIQRQEVKPPEAEAANRWTTTRKLSGSFICFVKKAALRSASGMCLFPPAGLFRKCMILQRRTFR